MLSNLNFHKMQSSKMDSLQRNKKYALEKRISLKLLKI